MSLRILVCTLLTLFYFSAASAQEPSAYEPEPSAEVPEPSAKSPVTNTVYLQGGAYMHFNYSDEHTDYPFFVGAEVQRSDNWIYGLGLFNNSFDQFSQYLYGGYKFKFKNRFKNFNAKLTAGIIHGYVDEYQDKIPVNSENGYGLGIVPSVGWKKDKLGFDVILLGNSGLLFTIGYDVYKF